MTELDKSYDPHAVETDIYADWESSGVFHADPDDDGEPFCIVIPPPNVTGSLHIGHALDNAIQDAIMRRERMLGKNAVWVPGTDHAGIATQMVVEKQLMAEGLTRHDLGREAFVERVWEWREQSGGTILKQLRKLGCGPDWDREAFTFDEQRNAAVKKVFVELYEQGLIYRGNRLINWDPHLHSALSDIEVEHEEVEGELVSFLYPFADDPDGGIVVATTRAETMLGDTAIAVHPEDERYTDIVGREVRHPFLDRTFPVIADEYVDPEFGSGAVKITPAHDPNDYAIGERHDLPMINIFTVDAKVNEEGGRFEGLDRFEARTAVKEALDDAGLLIEVKKHVHQVGHSSRSKVPVEPMLSDQWFVSVRPLADKAIEAVRDGRIRFVPERMAKPFIEWLENLHDWCISRQLWWGHRIPAWHHEETGEIRVSHDDIDEPGWVQDPDVLDTWFSSQLWPFVVLGWPEDTPEMRTWFPTSVLVTGYDINTFWVSRMAMISLWFTGEVPFHVVHNHGMVRDEHGKKMSKSFGNVIDPLDFIERYGADALRFALFQHCSPGDDVPLAEDWVEGARRFANKLWNALRFGLSNLDGVTPGDLPPADELALEDRWILSRLEAARAAADAAYDGYHWRNAATTLYSFAWDELADWYLEAAKVRLYGDDEVAKATVRSVLARVLDDLLRLLHPLVPFVTEKLWRSLTDSPGGAESLAAGEWPTPVAERDEAVEHQFAVLQDVVTELRRFRSQNDVAPSKRIDVTLVSSEQELLAPLAPLLTALAGIGELSFADSAVEDEGVSKVVFASGEAYVPLAGLIDVEAELARLDKELDNARKALAGSEGKLANESFVERAPEAVVQQERERRDEWARRISELEERSAALRSLA